MEPENKEFSHQQEISIPDNEEETSCCLNIPQESTLNFEEGDALVVDQTVKIKLTTKLKTNRKQLFKGILENGKEVFIKFMWNLQSLGVRYCSICLNNLKRGTVNGNIIPPMCRIEISIAGLVLNVERLEMLPFTKLELIIQLLSELYRLSKCNVIHNDIKPSNIVIVNMKNNEYRAKLIDFELSHRFNGVFNPSLDDEVYNDCGVVFSQAGTVYYNPPEKRGDTIITPQSDIYSMGKVILEVALGKILHPDLIACKLNNLTTRKKYFDNVHSNLYQLLNGMLKFNRKDRIMIEECFQILGLDPDDHIDANNYQEYFELSQIY